MNTASVIAGAQAGAKDTTPAENGVGPSNQTKSVEQLLGKRKRTRDDIDDVETYVPKKVVPGKGKFLGGFVLEQWLTPKPLNPIPWATHTQALTENPGFR
jgi:hypothetical protein